MTAPAGAAAPFTPPPGSDPVGQADDTAHERLRAEVDAEPANILQEEAAADPHGEPPEGTVSVAIHIDGVDEGDYVRVLPSGMWKASAMRYIQQGNFDAWAETSLFGDDYEEVWQEIDPPMDELLEFMKRYKKLVGADAGESRASRRRSMRTAGR